MQTTRRSFLKLGATSLAALMNLGDKETHTSSDSEINDESALEKIAQNREFILKSAGDFNLPPAFLASVIYDHLRDASLLIGAMERALSRWNDHSLGLGQIRPSVAALTDGHKDGITQDQLLDYRRMLLNPETNIHYTAKYLRFLLDKEHRFPGIKAEDLLKNPHAMAIIATEYRGHPTKSENHEARPSYYGYRIVEGLANGSRLYNALGIKPGQEGRLVSDYISKQSEDIITAKRIHDSEQLSRNNRRAGIAAGLEIVPLALAGGLYAAYLKLKNRRERHSVKLGNVETASR